MSAPGDPALREALYFSALTYRGSIQPLPDPSHSRVGRHMLTLHEESTSLGFGAWKLLWGPATHQMMRVPPDDTCVCVWGEGDAPRRIMVAVRGTNPGSVLDWVLGDFWAATQLPWEWDESRAAQISASTALGLATVLNLRSPRPDGVGSGTALWPGKASTTSLLGRVADQLVGPALDVVSVVQDLEALFLPKERRLRLKKAVEAMKRTDVNIDFQSLSVTWKDGVDRAPDELVREALARSRREGATVLIGVLDGREVSPTDGSQSLLQLLRHATASGTAEVVVTGHSKAGAVAVALATWLAQTQGPNAPDAVRWDPTGDTKVVCRAFAGPTPGNTAFKSVVAKALEDRCTRVFNPLDVVPHAWVPDEIRKISTLYANRAEAPPGLDSLGKLVARAVKDLDYAHAGTPHPLEAHLGPSPDFPLQAVHQHMDAYLQTFELEPLSAKVLFG